MPALCWFARALLVPCSAYNCTIQQGKEGPHKLRLDGVARPVESQVVRDTGLRSVCESRTWPARQPSVPPAVPFAAFLCISLAMLQPGHATAELSSKVEIVPIVSDTFDNVPQTLSGGDKARRIQRPKSAQAESCTRKCVSTCIRGGAGAPGEGPLNVRRPLVVFKEGFRSRQYCLLECSEICNLIPDGRDGP